MGQKLHFLTSIKLKMKIMNKLLLVLFCGISFYSSGQSDSLIIKGELKGLDSGKVYMSLRGENGKNVNPYCGLDANDPKRRPLLTVPEV